MTHEQKTSKVTRTMRLHRHLCLFLTVAFGCLLAIGCSSDPEPNPLPGGDTENAATPEDTSAAPTPDASGDGQTEETETPVPDEPTTAELPTTLPELAAVYLYDSTETLQFDTIEGLNPPCVWHFVLDTAVAGPGVSIFEMADGTLVAEDPVRVINACFFDGGASTSAAAMAGVLVTSGELGGLEVVDESRNFYASEAGLTYMAPALAEDGDGHVLTFQAVDTLDFSVREVSARRSADGTFTIDSTRHEAL